MADFETKKITYFSSPGKANTEKTIEIAVDYAKKNSIGTIVVATHSGETAIKVASKAGDIKVVAVTVNAGTRDIKRKNEWEKNISKMREMGIECIRGTQALSGCERGLRGRYSGMMPLMVVSDTLRMFSEGVKVCIEVALMAADNGAVSVEEDIVVVAGTSEGCDTALIVKPSYSSDIFKFGIKEILCMPLHSGVLHEAR